MSREEHIDELIQAIQSGERDKLNELWGEVALLVKWWANRLIGMVHGVEFDDLVQSGYIAMCGAVETYDRSGSFANWFAYYFKREIAALTGYRTERQRRDPLRNAQSLDEPLNGDTDTTFCDMVPDDRDSYGAVERRIWNEQLHCVLECALDKLTPFQATVLRDHYFAGLTLKQVGEREHKAPQFIRVNEKKALRRIRETSAIKELRQFIEDTTPYYKATGLQAFTQSGISSVESAVLYRERQAQAAHLSNF